MNAYAPSYSHDGQWIYFASNKTGKSEVWRMPAKGGSPVRVTSNGGTNPIESPNGDKLFYVKQSLAGSSVWCADTHGGSSYRSSNLPART
jgi:Tol biopolymer transport system component